MNKPWKVVLVFVGIFLAGAIAGGFGSLRFLKGYWQSRLNSENFAGAHLRRLTENLSLTDVQQERVRPIVHQAADELRKVWREAESITQRMDSAVQRELTPEQRVAFEEMQKRRKERFRQMEERVKRGGERPPPGQPPPPGSRPGPRPPD